MNSRIDQIDYQAIQHRANELRAATIRQVVDAVATGTVKAFSSIAALAGAGRQELQRDSKVEADPSRTRAH